MHLISRLAARFATGSRRFHAIGLFALLIMAIAPPSPALAAAAALLPSAGKEAAPAPEPAQSIDNTSDTGADERIASRIEGIFGALPALEGVSVAVSEGVVSLGGQVADAEDIDRAEQIASRVQGVVTVENGIERDLSVGDSLSSLGGLSEKFSSFLKMLPLIGAALLVALIIAAIGYLLASFTTVWRRLTPNNFLAELIASAIRFLFIVGGLVIALEMVGAGALLGAVLGGAGIIGIALGFAMRDTIENYVASIMLSVRQPFRPNDWVVIGDLEGRVIRLTSRATILMTLDGNHLRIPNGTVFKAVILNYTRNPQRRFDFDLGIDAADDPNAARQLGIEVLTKLDFVLDKPAPSARVMQVGDSNIVIKFLGWIDQCHTDWHKSYSQAIPAVKDALEEAGFDLPEPIYRLRFDSGAPLPLRNYAGEEEAAKEPKKPASAPAAAEHIGPVDVIAEMVEQERERSTEGEADLLDTDRPVE